MPPHARISSVFAALLALSARAGDGTPDLEELSACGNPSGPDLSEGPGFGCSLLPAAPETRRETGEMDVSGQVALSLLLALGLVRRRTPRLPPG